MADLGQSIQAISTGGAALRQGYYLVVYGDSYHPEVRGVIGWAGTSKAVAAKKIADLPWNAPRGASGEGVVTPPRKVAVVSQTKR